jgi:hypothetical protein
LPPFCCAPVLPRLDALCDGLHNLSATLNPSAERAAAAADAEAQEGGGGNFDDDEDDFRLQAGRGSSGAPSTSPLSAVTRAMHGGGADADGALAVAVSTALRSMLEDAELTLLTATRSAVALVRAHGIEGRPTALGGGGPGTDDASPDSCCSWISRAILGGGSSGGSGGGARSARGSSGDGSFGAGGSGGVRRRLPWVEQLRQLQVVAAAQRALARSKQQVSGVSSRAPSAAQSTAINLLAPPGYGNSTGNVSGHAGGGSGADRSFSGGEDEAASLIAARMKH